MGLALDGVNLRIRLYFIAIGMTGFGNRDISVGYGFGDTITIAAAGGHPASASSFSNRLTLYVDRIRRLTQIISMFASHLTIILIYICKICVICGFELYFSRSIPG